MLKSYTHEDFDHTNHSYGFFTRKGGISEGMYEGLNCGFGSDDHQGNVNHNRSLAAQDIGATPENLLGPYQIHSQEVVTVTAPFTNRPKADALVTSKVNLALSVLTADCAPVLFHGDGVIGAAHAGWKGALYGVLDNTIKAMQALGAKTVTACVGPCISVKSYEVSAEFKTAFLSENRESQQFFTNNNHFNLLEYCAWRLSRAGARTVSIIHQDTYQNEVEFYSYRRTTHRSESDYGRQISAIMLKKTP